jgi:hypothetical protein
MKRYVILLSFALTTAYLLFITGCGNPVATVIETTTTTPSTPISTTTVSATLEQSVYISSLPAQTVHDSGSLECFWVHSKVFKTYDTEKIYMQFSLLGVPANATIMTATLEIWAKSFDNGGYSTMIEQVTSAWDKSTIVIDTNEPTISSTNYAMNQTVLGMCSFNLRSIVQSWVNGTATNYGVMIIPYEPSDNSVSNRAIFYDYDSTQYYPRIEISYAN